MMDSSPTSTPSPKINSLPLSPDPTDPIHPKTIQNQRGKPIACLFVGSLNSSLSESQLTVSVKTFFQKYGPLLHVKVLKDWLQRSYSFVQFANANDASTALKDAQNALLDDRRIRIEPAKVNRTIYLANPSNPFNFSSSDVQHLLQPYGLIEEQVKTKDSSGYLVRFVYRDDAISAFLNLRNSPYKVLWAENVSTKSVFRNKLPNSSFRHHHPNTRPSKSFSSSSSSRSTSASLSQNSQRKLSSLKTFPNSSNVSSFPPSTPISSSLTTPTSATNYDESSDMSTPKNTMTSPYTSPPYSQSNFINKSPNSSKPSFPSPNYPPPYPYCQPLVPFIDPFSIFIDHLDSKNCSRNSIVELFSQYGKVLDCKLIRQSDKPAFAFLQFDSQQAAVNAVYHKPQPFFQKKPLRVKFRILPHSAYPVSTYQYPMASPSFLPSSRAIFPTVNSPSHSSIPYPCHPSMASLTPPATFGLQPDMLQPMYPYYPYPELCYPPGNLYYYGTASPSNTVGSE
ncbi:RNA-binding protein M [Schizosaccharomyces octosporus yFS286]|uniref:RNA-binding protein M n=1 Tax=Schizosaccharomyces octosporus (strain yFS286) TaxID=483514 RepID=S9R982_SCHOY|nr:RNA-binding protein M [Schizosaccharomyces octosporus yFS286]EPX70669.1 RNA-binding protein M [Schizosaccharomyces octosporus yFS286]